MYEHRVQSYKTDRMGITPHSSCIRWMEEARIGFPDRPGWNCARLEAEGIVSPVLSTEYHGRHSSALYDRSRIGVSVEALTGAQRKPSCRMTGEEGKTVCTGRSGPCFLSYKGRIVRLSRESPAFHATLAGQIPPKGGTPDAV